ncbi:MAG: hypothetical protein HC783_05520 [Rhodobacteraceae bacterium]|nr:hypothetical protein [Paracoccaceae bacterium]
MPLILQALPLSLKTFWRYLAILPILGVIACLLLLASFIPLVGLVVPGTVYAYCLMTGLRCALAARGHNTDPGFGHMLRAGVVFCLLTMAATFVIEAAAVLMPLGLSHAFGWLEGLVDDDPRLLAFVGGVFGLLILFSMLWTAALAVPMTFAVAGTSRGAGLNPLDGIGTGMIGFTLISIIWMIGGSFFSVFGEVATVLALLFETIRAVIAAEDPGWDWGISPMSLLGGTLWMAWASSWFFSAAVLYWERAVARRKATSQASVDAARVSSEDLRALRHARMRGTDGPPS